MFGPEMRDSKNIYVDQLLIFLIIVIGAFLRFYDYGNIPFTHDEFSALFRTQFSNFHDLIAKGVVVDTHPAGVQVFLFYWVKLTGFSEPLVKLPFTIFSLIAVYLIYSIGKQWFSSAAGLIAASFLAFLQYPVMYGQIARPYASGLFLVLLMVYFWTRLMLFPGKRYYMNLAAYVIASALCAYNHHFSLLFCGIVGITGVFILARPYRISYIFSWLIIALLYMPHLPIFFEQIKQGGIGGWLSKPRPDFIFDYLGYVFQFSWYVYALVFTLVILSLAWRTKGALTDFRLVMVSFAWFFIPLLVGFIYSLCINPVLQYSVLLFSFPFLLLLMFFYADIKKPWQKSILVGLCALVIIPSLISERKHYRLFYNSCYREIIVKARNVADSLGRSNCFILIDSHQRFTSYYLSKPEMNGFHINDLHDVFEPPVISSIVDACKAKYFVYGCISNSKWEDYPIIQAKYPNLLTHTRFNEGDFYVFTKDSVPGPGEYYFSSDLDFASNSSGWGNFRPAAIRFSGIDLKSTVLSMDSSLEFSPVFSGSLREICRHKNDIIDLTADVETPVGFSEAYLQSGIYQKETLLSFQSATIQRAKPGEFRRIYCSYRLADIEWRHHFLNIRGFIWNPKKQDLVIRRMSFRIRQGNPVLYGLYRKIE
ncbi:MAG: glycosyltransferase family 39 protein [Bacteroidetes bacterium]|nr:glycosyltransferase family 39 protein [Bacteroidota bacterium]